MMLFRLTAHTAFIALAGLGTSFVSARVSAQDLIPRAPAAAKHALAEMNPSEPRLIAPGRSGVPPAGSANQRDHRASITTDPINPLWVIPLGSLTPTRERPIFSPSRRPPAVAAPAPVQQPRPVPQVSQRPPFTLLGAIRGEKSDLAIFRDDTTQMIVRLKVGEGHLGWMLQAVQKREAILQKEHDTATFELPPVGPPDPTKR